MPPKKRRPEEEEDYEVTSSEDSSDELDSDDDSSDEGTQKKRKRYSSDDEYDPARDNVAQATSYQRTKKCRPSNSLSNSSMARSRTPSSTIQPQLQQQQQQHSFSQIPLAPAHVLQTQFHQPLYLAPAFNFTIAQLLSQSNPITLTPGVTLVSQPVATQSIVNQQVTSQTVPQSAPSNTSGFGNVVIDIDDDDDEENEPVASEAVENVATPAQIASTRKSDLESKILQELSALVAPSITLNMECETVSEEVDDSSAEEKDEAEKAACPEYEYGLRRTVFNNDLILTCETVTEEGDSSYAYPEDLTGKQRADYDSKLKAHAVFTQIFTNRKTQSYKMTEVDLGKTGETLSQFKERLRRDMRAAAQSHPHPNSSSSCNSSATWKQTAAKSTGAMGFRKT